MHRIFGKSKPKDTKPAPTLDDAQKSIDSRSGEIDTKITKLDEELKRYSAQMKKMKPGAAKNQMQQRALRVLKQKKLYEKQRDTLCQQSFNLDQTKFTQANIKDTVTVVAAMKNAAVGLKTEMKAIDLGELEDLQDDMTDLMEDAEEINEIMGRSYAMDDLDETDLMAELEGLEGELEADLEAETEQESVPAYLLNAASASKNVSQAQSVNVSAEPQHDIAVDEFGLPKVPQRNLA